MKVSEAIEKLTNKRNNALSFMSDIYKKGDAGYLANEIRVTTYNIAINTLQQIDEPQGEKVVVSQGFADWVESVKEDYGAWQSWCVKEVAGMGWGAWLHTNRDELDDLPRDGWTEEVLLDQEKHIKAIYNGYTVKPKRWVVKNGDKYFEKFSGCGLGRAWAIYQDQAYPFDDKSKAKAVATLVEGSVEEV